MIDTWMTSQLESRTKIPLGSVLVPVGWDRLLGLGWMESNILRWILLDSESDSDVLLEFKLNYLG